MSCVLALPCTCRRGLLRRKLQVVDGAVSTTTLVTIHLAATPMTICMDVLTADAWCGAAVQQAACSRAGCQQLSVLRQHSCTANTPTAAATTVAGAAATAAGSRCAPACGYQCSRQPKPQPRSCQQQSRSFRPISSKCLSTGQLCKARQRQYGGRCCHSYCCRCSNSSSIGGGWGQELHGEHV